MIRFRNWLNALSPRGQWAAGCVGSVAVVTFCLYGLGLASYVARPMLVATPPPPATIVVSIPTVFRPTLVSATPPPTFVLPGSTLEATPTQAPIPTRLPTNTPTPEGSGTPEEGATPDETQGTPLAFTLVPTPTIYTDTPAASATRRFTRTPKPATQTPLPRLTHNPTRTPRPKSTP